MAVTQAPQLFYLSTGQYDLSRLQGRARCHCPALRLDPGWTTTVAAAPTSQREICPCNEIRKAKLD